MKTGLAACLTAFPSLTAYNMLRLVAPRCAATLRLGGQSCARKFSSAAPTPDSLRAAASALSAAANAKNRKRRTRQGLLNVAVSFGLVVVAVNVCRLQ
jgi:hypothetical protein